MNKLQVIAVALLVFPTSTFAQGALSGAGIRMVSRLFTRAELPRVLEEASILLPRIVRPHGRAPVRFGTSLEAFESALLARSVEATNRQNRIAIAVEAALARHQTAPLGENFLESAPSAVSAVLRLDSIAARGTLWNLPAHIRIELLRAMEEAALAPLIPAIQFDSRFSGLSNLFRQFIQSHRIRFSNLTRSLRSRPELARDVASQILLTTAERGHMDLTTGARTEFLTELLQFGGRAVVRNRNGRHSILSSIQDSAALLPEWTELRSIERVTPGTSGFIRPLLPFSEARAGWRLDYDLGAATDASLFFDHRNRYVQLIVEPHRGRVDFTSLNFKYRVLVAMEAARRDTTLTIRPIQRRTMTTEPWGLRPIIHLNEDRLVIGMRSDNTAIRFASRFLTYMARTEGERSAFITPTPSR